MRETISYHTQCIRASSSDIWGSSHPQRFRPNLNIPLLTRIVSAISSDATSKSGKRKASEPPSKDRRAKRTRTSQGSRDNSEDSDSESNHSASVSDAVKVLQYPSVKTRDNCTLDQQLVPVLRHVMEIQYERESEHQEDVELGKAWDEEDETLQDIVFALGDSETIDLGRVQFGDYGGRIVAVSSDPRYHAEWLLLVPSLDIDGPSNDLTVTDLLSACRALQRAGKTHIEANLKLIPNTSHPTQVSFSLHLEFTTSLALPAALDYSVPRKSSKQLIVTLEDTRRRLLCAAFGEDYDDVVSSTVNEAITISSFYSVMEPAPQLLSEAAIAAMQPHALRPRLLPFQYRSVGWLLEREGMSVTADGSIVPHELSGATAFSFWKQVQAGNHTWYLNRLSGELVEHKPISPNIYGGMLAEEPGLGKTLETIALILLNPAPPEWKPTLTRWDEIARLNVKAVKTTLIVTPPALVSQWREELATHAPSLKVLVYDGWSKVKVPIVKNEMELQRARKIESADKRIKEAAAAAAKKKKKAAADAKKKTQGKRITKGKAKGRGKGKGKAADDGQEEDDDEDGMDVDQKSVEPVTRGDDGELLEWCDYVHQFDVVIITYSTLRSEIYVARPAPDRPRREEALYSASGRARSPLVMVEWKRVVMDEVQMVGGGQATEMVSLIPRLSSLAVSGTPAKAHMSDLIHVLKFLRIDQVVGDLRLWSRLLKPGFSADFAAFLRHYGIRTTKSSVTSELTIPQQTRYLVGIELGKIERHVYDQTIEAILLELGLDARGVAASEGWKINSNILRTSIRRLRGICTHPQVGQLQRKGDGIYKPGALKTMDAVLQSMRDQNWRNVMEHWKSKIQALIRNAQLVQHDQGDLNRYQHALEILQRAEKEVQKHIDEINTLLAEHDEKGQALKEEAASLRQKLAEAEPEADEATDVKGKGKAREMPADKSGEDGDGDEDPEEQGLPKTPAGDEHKTKRRAIKHRLREGLITLHRVHFLQGDVYHVLGNSKAEDTAYNAAEQLRRELLKATENEAEKAMDYLSSNADRRNLSEDELTVEVPLLGRGGVRSSDLMEEMNTLLEEVFNPQATLLWKWRTHILGLLSQSLTPGSDEADGQEYQRTLDDQGEAETYLQAYAALLADRREALINERTLLAVHDVREKKLRQTKAAMKAAAAAAASERMEVLEQSEGVDFQPEHEVLHTELSAERKDLLLRLNGRAVKSVLIDFNTINHKIVEGHPEKTIVRSAMASVRQFVAKQNALHDKLEADLTLMRKAFNQRILYFRQLQEISDSVAEVEWEVSVHAAMQACHMERAELEEKINAGRARQRYLENLVENKAVDEEDDDDKTCILCRCDFSRGFITQCAHVFCELCMKAWLLRKEGKSCPVCRVPIDTDTVQRFTVNSAETEPPPQPIAGEPAPQSRRQITYNRISPSLEAEISNMETFGDFGSKIQSLVRHLLYLNLTDPGAKSIIFSAWADSLHIVEIALRENGINTLRIDQNSKGEHATQKFRKDPEISVLLLHGERENAGLNITCASRVFLLESVVHHSFEIQAIARIDRLGQNRPTEVYCYYAEDTIERNILDLAARKGLSLYTTDNSQGTVSISPFADDNEKVIDDPDKGKTTQKGDFIHQVDDMLAILFPHMFEELEFLLPPAEDVPVVDAANRDVEMADIAAHPRIRSTRGAEVNATAGPSRLR